MLEGREAIRSQYAEAATLAAEALRAVRAGQAPEAAERGYDDLSFLQEFFPGQAAQLAAAAAALVASSRARTLAEQRTRLGLTQAELAQRMGVRQERVSAIERAEPGADRGPHPGLLRGGAGRPPGAGRGLRHRARPAPLIPPEPLIPPRAASRTGETASLPP